MEERIQIDFEERIVAFVDILGFKEKVLKAEKSDDQKVLLCDLVNDLRDAIPKLDAKVKHTIPDHLKPKHLYISDCIILSAPIKDDKYEWYDGLSIIVMRCIQLVHEFLAKGFLLNGGISVGNVWHVNNNIIGSGYQSAYQETQTENLGPRILLSKAAEELWATIPQYGSMCIRENDGHTIVNGLHDYYIPGSEKHGGIEAAYKKYRKIILDNINELEAEIAHSNSEKVKEKKERALIIWGQMDSLLENQLKRAAIYIEAESHGKRS